MALVTRCPNCATAFRVTPLHLQAHGGDVRCGHCAHLFNGYATLATMQDPEDVDLPPTAGADMRESVHRTPPVNDLPAPAISDQEVSPLAPCHEIQPEVTAEAVTQGAPNREPPAAAESAPQASDTVKTPRNYAARDHASQDHASHDYAAADPAEAYAFEAAPSPKTSAAWGFASLLLLVVLAAQAIYFYRAELSVIAPGAKPYLEQYCELLQCTIPLPQNAALLSIESSEMQANTQRAGVVTLTATVRNHAPYSQAFPLFELTLTDPRDQPLARHIFAPDAYLGGELDPAGAIAPDNEFNVKLQLDSGDLNAAGYRLYLFYPGS